MHSISADIARTARRTQDVLGATAERTVAFILSRLNKDGGFRGRGGASDLYYSFFAAAALDALGVQPPRTDLAAFLARQGSPASLDFIHAACLARLRALLEGPALPSADRAALAARIEDFRAAGGGYKHSNACTGGSVYGCLMASLVHEDLGVAVPDPDGILACINQLRTADGAYANEQSLPLGTTTATAGALVLLDALDRPPDEPALRWLASQWSDAGGFIATPGAPVPDLLSTGTALYALTRLHRPLPVSAHKCGDAIRAFLDPSGGFRGVVFDTMPDCEYTYYGLLAVGCAAGNSSIVDSR